MTATIVSIAEVRANASDPVLSQIEAYWDALRAGRTAPARAQVNPRGLSDVLSHCFVLERVAKHYASFRVYGRKVTELMGLELREMPVTAPFFAESREILEETLVQVFDRPAAARLSIESPGSFRRERIEGRLSLLPLRDDLGQTSRILGGISYHGDVGRSPRRLEITAKSVHDLERGVSLPRAATHRPRSMELTDAPATVVQLPLSAD